jgi:hypothetical protein
MLDIHGINAFRGCGSNQYFVGSCMCGKMDHVVCIAIGVGPAAIVDEADTFFFHILYKEGNMDWDTLGWAVAARKRHCSSRPRLLARLVALCRHTPWRLRYTSLPLAPASHRGSSITTQRLPRAPWPSPSSATLSTRGFCPARPRPERRCSRRTRPEWPTHLHRPHTKT